MLKHTNYGVKGKELAKELGLSPSDYNRIYKDYRNVNKVFNKYGGQSPASATFSTYMDLKGVELGYTNIKTWDDIVDYTNVKMQSFFEHNPKARPILDKLNNGEIKDLKEFNRQVKEFKKKDKNYKSKKRHYNYNAEYV